MAYKIPKPQVRRPSKAFTALRSKLISLADLMGREVVNQDGQYLGKVADLVFRWDTEQAYPPLAGIIVRVARRHVWITGHKIDAVTAQQVKLATAKIDMREFRPREGEVRLAKEVLDHQLIDVDGARVVRASDLYIAQISGQIRLVGVEVGLLSLVRRVGPRKLRGQLTPDQVVDWATIKSFGGPEVKSGLKLAGHRKELQRLRPGELADLIEDLGRDERLELLNTLPSEQAADAIEEMEPEEVETILRESAPQDAAKYLSNMEPDEAADALRDIDDRLREHLLSHMTKDSVEKVEEVLSYDEESAGGFMNTSIIELASTTTIAATYQKLTALEADLKEIDSVVVVDRAGRLVQDLAIIDVLMAKPELTLADLVHEPEPVTVPPDASIREAAELFIEGRRSSILVVDENQHPLGRIFADDVIDALLPKKSRFHFPRLLS